MQTILKSLEINIKKQEINEVRAYFATVILNVHAIADNLYVTNNANLQCKFKRYIHYIRKSQGNQY